MLSLAQLDSLRWIARLGSFRAAAERCNRTQSTVSLRIQELEHTLGARLLERDGQGVRLTPAGLEILPLAEEVLARIEGMRQALRRGDRAPRTIRLGTNDSFALTCLPDLLREVADCFPRLQVDVTVEHSRAIAAKLNAGELDVGFLLEAETHYSIVVEPLCQVPHAWVASPALPVARGAVHPSDLEQMLIFSLPPPATTFDDVHRWFASAGLQPQRVSTCNSLPTIIPLVLAGLGVALLPRPVVFPYLDAERLIELSVRPAVADRRLMLAYHRMSLDGGLDTLLELGRRFALERLAI